MTLHWVAVIGLCLVWIALACSDHEAVDAVIGWLCTALGLVMIAQSIRDLVVSNKGGRRGN